MTSLKSTRVLELRVVVDSDVRGSAVAAARLEMRSQSNHMALQTIGTKRIDHAAQTLRMLRTLLELALAAPRRGRRGSLAAGRSAAQRGGGREGCSCASIPRVPLWSHSLCDVCSL